jgi:hypothetical protein
VILTQSAFEAIPMSKEQQQAYIDREMEVMRRQLAEAQASDQNDQATKRTVKKMETAMLRAEEALKKKLAKQKDVGVSFEQTGIDYLMVDEAHMYSNLRTLSNIQGAGTVGLEPRDRPAHEARISAGQQHVGPGRDVRHRHADPQHDHAGVRDAAVPAAGPARRCRDLLVRSVGGDVR